MSKGIILTLFVCLFTYGKASEISHQHIKEVLKIFKNQGVTAAEAKIEKMGVTPYDFGMTMATMQYRTEAIQLFDALVLSYSGDLEMKYFFGRSWVYFMEGNLDDSMKSVSLLLNKSPSRRLEARAKYLAGNIHFRWQKYKLALKHLEEAEEIYRELNANGGIFLTTLIQAAVALRTGNLDYGYELLDEARSINNSLIKPYNEAYIEDALGNYHLQKGNLEAAERHTTNALESYRIAQNADSEIWMRIRRGHVLALAGEIDEAYKCAEEVEQMIRKNGYLIREAHYNNLTWVHLLKCSNFSYESIANKMKAWAETNNGGTELLDLLSRMEKANCR